MKHRSQTISNILAICGIAGGLFALWVYLSAPKHDSQLGKSGTSTGTKVTEDDLGVVKLAEENARKLGIETAQIEKKQFNLVRSYGGEVVIPLGQSILVSAPLSGILQVAEGGPPRIGQTVKKGQQIFSLLPLLSPEASTNFATAKADAEGQVKNAQTQVETAKMALERAQRIYQAEAGSKRSVEEAQAQYDLALRSSEAVTARLGILGKALTDSAAGRSTPIPIFSPETGIIRNINAMPQQNVPASGALFEIANLSRVWIRVPVFAGDIEKIAGSESAEITPLSSRSGAKILKAGPINAPPTANAVAATVDLHYELDNSEAHFAPGQRVSVSLLLKSTGESLTIPSGAVLYDIHGNTWVYTEIKPLTFKRQRVNVQHTSNGITALANGPQPGTRVVTVGAVELFGAETGFSK